MKKLSVIIFLCLFSGLAAGQNLDSADDSVAVASDVTLLMAEWRGSSAGECIGMTCRLTAGQRGAGREKRRETLAFQMARRTVVECRWLLSTMRP